MSNLHRPIPPAPSHRAHNGAGFEIAPLELRSRSGTTPAAIRLSKTTGGWQIGIPSQLEISFQWLKNVWPNTILCLNALIQRTHCRQTKLVATKSFRRITLDWKVTPSFYVTIYTLRRANIKIYYRESREAECGSFKAAELANANSVSIQ